MAPGLSGRHAGGLLNAGKPLSYCKEQLLAMGQENWGDDVVKDILSPAVLPVQYFIFQSHL